MSSPQRKGVLQCAFEGDPFYGELARLSEGEEVTEVKPDEEGWTLVETSDGTKGKVPTDHVSWSQPGENQNVNI